MVHSIISLLYLLLNSRFYFLIFFVSTENAVLKQLEINCNDLKRKIITIDNDKTSKQQIHQSLSESV